jgi:hypothetical protein
MKRHSRHHGKHVACDLCGRQTPMGKLHLIHEGHLPCSNRVPEAIKQLRYEEAIAHGETEEKALGFASAAVVCEKCIEDLRASSSGPSTSAIH